MMGLAKPACEIGFFAPLEGVQLVLAAERATPEYQAKFAERREKIRRMLDVIGPKSAKGRTS